MGVCCPVREFVCVLYDVLELLVVELTFVDDTLVEDALEVFEATPYTKVTNPYFG